MLPSFRLIAATFLCGFFVVFAGLRLAASLNDIHEGLPVMSAHAAPVSITPVVDREARRGLSSVPVMYDLRFAVSPVAPTLIRVAPTVLDRPAPASAIAPIEEAASPVLETTVAALQSDSPSTEAPAVIQDAPDDQPALKLPALAAIDSQARPGAASNWPAADTPAGVVMETPTPPTEKTIEQQVAALPSPEEPLASPEPAPAAETAPVETPAADSTASVPAPAVESQPDIAVATQPQTETPKAAKPAAKKRHAARPARKAQRVARIAAVAPVVPAAAAAPNARAKAKIARPRHIRTAARPIVSPVSPFGTTHGTFSVPPIGAQQ